jgi:protein-S-isoprenylcysteine O-methyltransferase Ste14
MAHIGPDTQPWLSRIERYKAFEHTKIFDLLVALPLIVWYGLSASARFSVLVDGISVTDFSAINLRAIVGLISTLTTLVFISTLIALLIFRDKPQGKSEGLFPRAAAIAGTYLSVAIIQLPPVELSNQIYYMSTLLAVVGTLFALYSALNLDRSLSMMSEARQLVVCGPYAVIRHPLYLGEGIVLVGLTLQFLSLSAVLILILQCACQAIRMNNEEQVLLKTFPQYRNYMARTSRLIPHLY